MGFGMLPFMFIGAVTMGVLCMLGFLPFWMLFMYVPIGIFMLGSTMWFGVGIGMGGGYEPQITSTPTYISTAPQPVSIYPPGTPQFIREELEMSVVEVGTDKQSGSERWFREAKERGAPFIMNTHTEEIQQFPSIGEALRVAKIRDEDIFRATDAPSLTECPHWLAYSESGVLVLDDIPAWRYFHPDRPLTGADEIATREEVTTMVNQLIQKKDREPIKREVVTDGNILIYERKIQDGFTKTDFKEGLKVFSRIKKEHDLLKPLLADSGALNSLVNLKRIGQLTESLYLQGLSFLVQASGMSEQLGQTNIQTLGIENQELKEKLEGHEPGSNLYNMITERLEKNARGLETVKEHRDRMDEVLMEAGLCRDSMREIRLELPELVGHQSKDELEKVMLELRTRIDFAQRVQEEYTKQGL